MKALILAKLVEVLLRELQKHAPALLKNFADTILDWIEEYVQGTASTIDDALLLPICNMVRETLNIPDEN